MELAYIPNRKLAPPSQLLVPVTGNRVRDERDSLTQWHKSLTFCEIIARKYALAYPAIAAEDFLAEAYAVLAQAVNKWDPERASFFTFAALMIRHRMARVIQREQRPSRKHAPHLSLDELLCAGGDSFLDLLPDPTQDPALAVIGRYPEVTALLPLLTPREQEILRLRFECGLNYREIGELCGGSRQCIQQTVSRACRKLRLQLGQRVPVG